MDAIDKTSDCIRLRWERTPAEQGRLTAGCEFGVIPIGSICGVVHVVPRDSSTPQTANCSR